MKTNSGEVRVEKTYNAKIDRVWQALTDPALMKQWYFDLPGFRPEVGYEFSFLAGDDTTKWLHLCKVTAVKPNKLIAYTWRYDGYGGDSLVTFELFDEGDKTRLVLTHTGLDTFPADVKAFDRKNFEIGWNAIIDTSLAKFLE